MVKVVKGVLVECCNKSDSAMKQLLLYLDEINELGTKFVIQDLDETHLFIDSESVDRLKEKIDDLMEKYSYQPDKPDGK